MEQRLKFGNRDLFRSRKQNTSRPPSMHVDDFMAKVSFLIARFNPFLRCITVHPHIQNSPRSMSRGGHHMGSGPDRGHLPYMPPQPGMFVPPMGGRHWMGPVPPGVGYQRRDMGLGMRPWDSRLPQSFMPAMKPIMRCDVMIHYILRDRIILLHALILTCCIIVFHTGQHHHWGGLDYHVRNW